MTSVEKDVMVSIEEMQNAIVSKAMKDGEFRANLLADPKSALNEEFDVSLPEVFSVTVHESKGTSLHIALPPTVDELDEGQLEGIAGGTHYGPAPF